MARVQKLKRLIFFVAVATLLIFILKVKTAGQIRQVRFNMKGLFNVISQYHKGHGRYPNTLSDLPKFYVVSAIDKLYFDSAHFTGCEFDGYRYDYKMLDDLKFALSASPKRLWPMAVEFGITEDGQLKINDRYVDNLPDSREEVNSWRPVGF